MATKLEKALKREIAIGDKAYMLTIDPQGLKLVEKGRRNGLEVRWQDLLGQTSSAAPAAPSPGEQPA